MCLFTQDSLKFTTLWPCIVNFSRIVFYRYLLHVACMTPAWLSYSQWNADIKTLCCVHVHAKSIWSRSSTCARILPGSVTWLFVINLQTVLANIQFKVFIHQYRWEENKRSSLKVSTDQHKSLFRCWSTEDAPVILPEYINLCHLSNLSATKELIFSVGRRSVVECVISYVIHNKHC